MIILRKHIFLFLGIFLFLALSLPFIKTLPYLDGNIDFIQTTDFYHGGISQYFANWNTVHPPLKLFLNLPLYYLLGISSASYSFPGILIGVSGIIGIYFLARSLFDQKTANISALIFSAYPLMIANAIFFMRDYLLTVLLIISLLFYKKNKFYLYAATCSLAILTKESSLLLPVIIIFIEFIEILVKKKLSMKKVVNVILISIPLLVYFVWKSILEASSKTSWNEWIFTDTHGKGATFVILNNLLTFKFLNPYAFEHWKQLIFLNFNWIYLVIILFGFGIYLSKNRHQYLKRDWQSLKVRLVIIIFCLSYFLTVLCLQTYTIPRYALPLIPFLIIVLSKSITTIKNFYIQITLSLVVFIFILTSLFSSIDPLANHLWGKIKIFDQKIYALNDHLAGSDGITYNMQYLLIAKNRSQKILNTSKTNIEISSNYCHWIFPDPNNDKKMITILNIRTNLKCNNLN